MRPSANAKPQAAKIMNNLFQPFLDRFGIVILDGALATELERRGANIDDPLWSAKLLLDNPSLIRQVHYDYFSAGADVATTATYQATFQELAKRGLDATQAAEVFLGGVRIAQEAREQFWSDERHRRGRLFPLVAASIGCYGAFLHDGSEYRGDYGLSIEQLVDFHRPRWDVLARSGADLLACETIPCLAEAEALARLCHDYAQTPAWVSFSCKDEGHVCHNERLADCVAAVEGCANVVAVGINCTAPRFVSGLLRSIAGRTSKSLVVYPNSGEAWDQQAKCWRGESSPWVELVSEWRDRGARIIGGCCRTTPEQIATVAQTLAGRNVDEPKA